MKQFDYYLEGHSGKEWEQQFAKCLKAVFQERIKTLRKETAACLKEKPELTVSFEAALSNGALQAFKLAAAGKKGAVRFIHFSYLLSSALSGEMLIKLDCYDETYYSDIADIDCYWDYGGLFPNRSQELKALEDRLRCEIVRLTPYEISQARLYYQVLYFMVLEDILCTLVASNRSEEIIRSCAAREVSVLYGAYFDQAKRIHKVLEVGG